MNSRSIVVATAAALALITASGCAVTRGPETVGAWVDDTAISVETLNGVVMLSGFATSGMEESAADSIARNVEGVKGVKNEIAVRP